MNILFDVFCLHGTLFIYKFLDKIHGALIFSHILCELFYLISIAKPKILRLKLGCSCCLVMQLRLYILADSMILNCLTSTKALFITYVICLVQ